MGKVTLVPNTGDESRGEGRIGGEGVRLNGNAMKCDGDGDGDNVIEIEVACSDFPPSESEEDTSSSSSGTSSSSDDDDEEEEAEVEMEEGEITAYGIDETVAWSADEDDDVALGGNVAVESLKSKNELTVLPPVLPVNVALQPHHQTVPVGVVLSIVGAQVIVEGVEKHNPLDEGSILWITQTRSPLGIVDETFGPVKNPYYIIRHNSESEVLSGLIPGDSVCFVPEFANHILHDKRLYVKAYDASGANDEEISEEEEFSDDEKEAEYRKMLKMMKKRGNNHKNVVNKKMDRREPKNKFGNRKHDHAPRHNAGQGNQVRENHQHPVPPPVVPPKMDLGNNNDQCSNVRPGFTQPFSPFGQNPGFTMQSAGANGIPFQTPQSMAVAGFPNNNTLPWLGQVNPQMLSQMNMQNGLAAFGQQIGMNPTSLPQNHVFPTVQPGFGSGPGFTPWPSLFAMVTAQGQLLPFPFNAGQQAFPFNLQQMGHNSSINTNLTTTSQPETSAISSQGPYQNLSNPSQMGLQAFASNIQAAAPISSVKPDLTTTGTSHGMNQGSFQNSFNPTSQFGMSAASGQQQQQQQHSPYGGIEQMRFNSSMKPNTALFGRPDRSPSSNQGSGGGRKPHHTGRGGDRGRHSCDSQEQGCGDSVVYKGTVDLLEIIILIQVAQTKATI